ncbi:MAG: LCP family protein [Holdemanella sp.]|nr:LCP family protein [Holdemanella sp.]
MSKKIVKKKRSKFFTAFSIILSIVLLGFCAAFIYQLKNMNVLPDSLFLPASVALVLFCVVFVFLQFFYTKKIFSKIFVSLLVICLCIGTGFGNYYLYKTANTMQKVTKKDDKKIKNTVSVIVNKSSNIEKLSQLKGKKVGKLKNIDTEGTKKALTQIRKDLELEKKADLPFTTEDVNSVQEAVNMLYEEKLDAIILNEAYRSNVLEMEAFADFNDKTTVIHKTVFYTKDTNEPLAVSDITQTPFNILISGNDSYGEIGSEVSRSDVNMVVTINPLTSTVLLTSIPRDAYVTTVCDATDVCAYGGMDKLTHTGIHGVNVTKRTVENMLNIEINYTFVVNFSSLTSIVDALGGIDIEVPQGMAVHRFYSDSSLEGVTEGLNHLNGDRALAFSRERKAYLDGDLQRVRNQQIVLEAIFEKATSPSIITQYASLMDALANAFQTNLSVNEITDLIKFQIQTGTSWKFENYQVIGYSDMLVCAEAGQELSVIVPYAEAIDISHRKIEAVLKGESSTTIEDTFDANSSQGTLSREEIDAQIDADLYGSYYSYDYYYDPNTQNVYGGVTVYEPTTSEPYGNESGSEEFDPSQTLQ